MAEPTCLVPGNYVIFVADSTDSTTVTVGRSNYAVTCPLSGGGAFSITTLRQSADASPTQIFLVTGDGMMLSKTSSNGSLAQAPTFYASFSLNSPNIVTKRAPAAAGPDTKFVIQVNMSGPSTHGDDICYLATVMTGDLTDQFWTVDRPVNNEYVKAASRFHSSSWVFVPLRPYPGLPSFGKVFPSISSLIAGNYVIFAESPSDTNQDTNGRSNYAVTCPLSNGADLTINRLLAASSARPTQVWLITGDGMMLSRTSSTGSMAQTPTFYASYTGNSPNIVTTLAPAVPAPHTKFVIQIAQTAESDHGDALSYLGTVMTADLTDQFWTVDDLRNNDEVKADTFHGAKNWVFVPI